MPGDIRFFPSLYYTANASGSMAHGIRGVPASWSLPDSGGIMPAITINTLTDSYMSVRVPMPVLASPSDDLRVRPPTTVWSLVSGVELAADVDGIRARWSDDAKTVGKVIADFLASTDGKFRWERLPLLFYAVGEILADCIRTAGGLWKEDFLVHVSAAILAKNTALFKDISDSFVALEGLFSPENLAAMHRLALVFPRDYVESLAPHLTLATREPWTLIKEIIAIEDPYERIYFAEMCAHDRWNLTTFRHHQKMGRFHTHTMARLDTDRLRAALVSLSRGDRSEWIYRDLMRFDFLDITDDEFKVMNEQNDFQKRLLEHMDKIIDELGAREFNYTYSQPTLPARDDHDEKCEPRLDILTYVNDGADHYPVVIELKKGAFDAKVFKQCERYLAVMNGPDGDKGRIPAGYLKHNERKALVMALVTKVDRELEDIMRVGLNGDGHRGTVFVTLYTYRKPPREFLDKAIGVQLRASAERSVRDRERLQELEVFPEAMVADPDRTAELFRAIMGDGGETPPLPNVPADSARDPSLPF